MMALPSSGWQRPASALAAAVVLEAMLLGVVVATLGAPSRPVAHAVPLSLATEPAPTPVAPVTPLAPPPMVRSGVPRPPSPRTAATPSPPAAPAPAAVAPSPNPEPVPARNAPDTAAPSPHPVPAAAPAVPIAPASPDPDLLARYHAQLTAAVQAAFIVPLPAMEVGFKGRARVTFELRDGVPSEARIAQGSGMAAVDRAALKAVMAARYPEPPANLRNRQGHYQIWVACL